MSCIALRLDRRGWVSGIVLICPESSLLSSFRMIEFEKIITIRLAAPINSGLNQSLKRGFKAKA